MTLNSEAMPVAHTVADLPICQADVDAAWQVVEALEHMPWTDVEDMARRVAIRLDEHLSTYRNELVLYQIASAEAAAKVDHAREQLRRLDALRRGETPGGE